MCERPRTRSHPNTWLKAYWGVNIRANNSLIKHRYNSSTWVSATSAICSQSHRLLLLLLQTWLQRCTLIVCIGVNVDGLGRRVSQIPPIYYLTDTPTGKLPVFNFYSFIWSRHTHKNTGFQATCIVRGNHVPVLLISSDWLIAVSNVGATVVGKT